MMLWVLLISACNQGSYSSDSADNTSGKDDSDFLLKQAISFTQNNIENKPKNQRKARKRQVKIQKVLNEANENTSKVKPTKKHSGNFKFY